MLLVTGGAGFIGSNVVAALNEAGRSDIVVNDVLGTDQKWRNLAKRQVTDVVAPADLFRWLDGRKLDAVVHMGAISDTTATDADLVMENNFRVDGQVILLRSIETFVFDADGTVAIKTYYDVPKPDSPLGRWFSVYLPGHG